MYYVNYITQENLIVSQFKTMHPKLFLYSLLASSFWLLFFFFLCFQAYYRTWIYM